MEKIFLSKLEGISNELSIEIINQLFQDLINQIQSYLELEPFNQKVKIKFITSEENFDNKFLFDYGVIRNDKEYLTIEIFKSCKKFFPFILLREAYNIFVPNSLRKSKIVGIVINQIIINDLKSFKINKEWDRLFRKQLVNQDFISSDLDRLDNFLNIRGTKTVQKPIPFFFEYIRRNFTILEDDKKNFYDIIFKDFVFKTSKSLFNDDIIETIRVLIKIFYKVKKYSALLDYQNYFMKFKRVGEIKTYLTLRKFTSNMQWIKKFSYFAPSYQILWKAMDIIPFLSTLKFNPLLENSKIIRFVKDLPFFLQSKSSTNNFAIEFSGWFLIPKKYYEDFLTFYKKLSDFGYIIKKSCIQLEGFQNNLNLNYYRDFTHKGRLLSSDHKFYDKKYEIEFKVDYGNKKTQKDLSVLDFILLDRIRYFSINGFGFERKENTFKLIKSDFLNEILNQKDNINKFIDNAKFIHSSEEIKEIFLQFLKNNKKFGFFYIKNFLVKLIISLNLVYKFLTDNPSINSIYRFQAFCENQNISNSIEKLIEFNNPKIKKVLLNDFLPIFFKNKNTFKELLTRFQAFKDFVISCENLKIFDLKTIEGLILDFKKVDNVKSTIENNLKIHYKQTNFKKITSLDVEKILDSYINNTPPLIQPYLISTISTGAIAKYYIEFILVDNQENRGILNKLRKYFPRMVIGFGKKVISKEKMIQVEIYLPNISTREKVLLISIISTLFKDNIWHLKRYFWDGLYSSYSIKDYYDFNKQDFIYIKDLFDQFFVYGQELFGGKLEAFKEASELQKPSIWQDVKSMDFLIKQVNNRISRNQVDFKYNVLKKLYSFHLNLEKHLYNSDLFTLLKNEDFFNKYIRSIQFIPAYHHFGFGQYYLYIRPINLEQTDLKLLLSNTFQRIKTQSYIENTPSFLIKYIFPFQNPNKAYLNWITKSKKNISEYCLFSVKRIYQILHFDSNLSSSGWSLDYKQFKAHVKRVLLGLNLVNQPLQNKIFDLEGKINSIYTPDSKEYNDLTKIFGYKSVDIKTIATNVNKMDLVRALLKKGLIFPYIKTKNLDLVEKVSILIPDMNQEDIIKVIKIFNYFNLGFIYEIEGEYFIYGFKNNDDKKFENGLLIKLFLPKEEIIGFQKVFDSIFEYLDIKKYLLLNDMVDITDTILPVFKEKKFQKSYSPLKNLNFNSNDKKWTNVKLYEEDFKKRFPNLI